MPNSYALNKEKFIIKSLVQTHATCQYSPHSTTQVSSKKPPVSTKEASRPEFAKSAPSPAISILGSSGQNGKTPISCSSEIKENVIAFGAFRSDFLANSERARILAEMQTPQDFRQLPFETDADIWLELHKEDDISSRTIKDYEFYIRCLLKTFKGMQLSQIHIGHIIEHRKMRQKTAGAWCINHEITTLKQIMEKAELWDLIAKHYRPMKIQPSSAPKVMTAEEEERFFRIAADKPEWQVAYWAASLTNNTSAYGAELRFLQLRHIHLDHVPPKIHIPDEGAKNEFRARVVPLNAVALKQTIRLLERAKRLGAYKPDHYAFPFRIKKGEYDVNRPASAFFIRSAFRSICKATGIKITPRNLRNQIITKLFESGAPDETIISIAGHQAIKMSRYYSKIRLTAKLDALDKISPQS